MRLAFLGWGNVGGALADHLQRLGHDVTLASKDLQSPSLAQARTKNPGLKSAPVHQAVAAAEVTFLATPFAAIAEALRPAAEAIKGKVLVDCTNPVGPGLTHGLQSVRAGSEVVQEHVPQTAVVKAFSIYGYENFVKVPKPQGGIRPAMMFCGNDTSAKVTVGQLIETLGWQPVDVGGLGQALHLEHMTLLWIRMVRQANGSPHTVWAKLNV